MKTWMNQWHLSLFELWMLSKQYQACSQLYLRRRRHAPSKTKRHYRYWRDVRLAIRQMNQAGRYV